MISRIQPCEAPSQGLHLKRSSAEVFVIDARDLDLASGRGLHALRDLNHVVVIEIEARNGVIGLRMLRLFLDRERFPVRVELYHAVLPGILYIIAKDGRSLLPLRCPFQHLGKTLAIENIVAQNQRHRSSPINFSPIRKASASPLGYSCTA